MEILRIFQNLGQVIKKSTYGLHKKMFIVIFLIGMVLTISLSIAILIIARSYISQDLNDKLRNQTQQISNIIDSYLEDMKKIIIAVNLNQNVIDLMNGEYTPFQSYIIYRDIYRLLSTLKSANQWNHIYIFCGYNKDLLSSDPLNITGDYSEYHIEDYGWYKNVMDSITDLVLLDDFISPVTHQGNRFALALRVQHYYNPSIQGVIVISTDKSYFSDMIKNTSLMAMDFLVIANPEGKIVYLSNKEQLKENGINQETVLNILNKNAKTYISSSGRKYIVDINKSSKTNWSIISFSNEKILVRNFYRINAVVIVITLIFIGLLLVFSYFISSQFTKPVSGLMKLMQKAESQGYRVVSNLKRNDEIGDLSLCFNAMVRKVLENQVLRKEAEIDALQQQINPHFLYNTLESIKTLAAIHGCNDIRSMAQKLGEMFRYSINREGNKIVSIAEEIQHVENYIFIQKIRYEDRMNVLYDIDAEIYSYLTLKFILQPIVENAIYHGIEEMSSDGLITIKGYIDGGSIVFEISDNGNGIDEAALEKLNDNISGKTLNAPLKKTQGIGLRNIHERIRLFFGEDFGLKIYSRKGVGTSVVLKIPVWQKREENVSV